MALIWKPTMRRSAMLAGALVLYRVMRRSPNGANPKLDPAEIRRILIVELWNIGDVVLVIPFLAMLRERFPNAKVSLLAAPHAELLLRDTGLVDEFIETDLGVGAGTNAARTVRELRRLRPLLRKREFDLAFQARMHLREHLLLARSGAKRTVGYSFGDRKGILTDPILVSDPDRHRVEDWMELLTPFGGKPRGERSQRLTLTVSPAEEEWAAKFLSTRGILPGDELIAIHPGASKTEKRWPLQQFGEIATQLTDTGRHVLALVEPSGYGASLGRATRNGAAKVGLREMIAVIAKCRLLVCNDSGPMHIAGALGVPTVAVFGPAVSRWFAPLGEGHEIISEDDGSSGQGIAKRAGAGVKSVPTADVLAAVERVLKRS